MVLKIAQFVQLLLFSIIAGQAFFYFIGGTAALKNVSASAFIEQRQAIDAVIAPYLKGIYPLTLLISGIVLVVLRQPLYSTLFIGSAMAFLLVLIDMAIAVTGNIPLNRLIASWSAQAYPDNWRLIRDQWLGYMQWRQVCSIAGLICLLIGLVWPS